MNNIYENFTQGIVIYLTIEWHRLWYSKLLVITLFTTPPYPLDVKVQSGQLTCMNVGVFFHVRFLVETFAAILARVRAGVRMDQQMGGQSRRPFKRFPALLTLKQTNQSLNHPVQFTLNQISSIVSPCITFTSQIEKTHVKECLSRFTLYLLYLDQENSEKIKMEVF